MIISLRTTNIFNVLDALPAITAVVEVFSEKPAEEYVRENVWDDSYLYLSIVTDNTTTGTDSKGALTKEAIVSFNIVAGLNKPNTDTDVLFDIIDILNEEIANEGCTKIPDWDWITVRRVTELSPSPIAYNTKNRAVMVKQYLFTYYAQ